MKDSTFFFQVGTRRHWYTLSPVTLDGEQLMYVRCPAARVDQEFLPQDVPELILSLPDAVARVEEASKDKAEVFRLRLSAAEKREIERRAAQGGFTSASEYVRAVAAG